MSIPLNIDWQQILLHLLNFAILAIGLYLLLYKPVKDFIDKRSDYYKQMDDDAKQKLANAESMKKSYQEKLDAAQAEIKQMKANAAKDAEEAAAGQLQHAKKEAEVILANAKAYAAAERDQIVASAQDEITQLAVSAVEKMAQKSLNDSYDEFLSAAKGDGAHGKQK